MGIAEHVAATDYLVKVVATKALTREETIAVLAVLAAVQARELEMTQVEIANIGAARELPMGNWFDKAHWGDGMGY